MNNCYEVLTEDGFKPFYTVSQKTVDEYLRVYFSDNNFIDCTLTHQFKVGNEFKEARDLVIDDLLSPEELRVVDVVYLHESLEVYDLVNVEDGNHYLTNGITSHNCEFLTEELTLVDAALITQAERIIQLKIEADELIKFTVNNDKFQFFKKLVKDATYLVGVDPSTGSGNDNGVIQVFEFPAMEQVLEFTVNTLSPQVFYTELKALLNFLGKASEEIYFSVENNGVGQGILAAYEGDQDPPMAALVSEKDKVGFNSNVKTKLRACLQFKEAFERNRMTLNSPQLLTELKSFIRHQGSYAAHTGATDDRIMGCMIVFYIIQQISMNNVHAYDMIYSVAAEIEERHGWTLEKQTNNDTKDGTPREEQFTRSAMLQAFFDNLHGENNNTGFTSG